MIYINNSMPESGSSLVMSYICEAIDHIFKKDSGQRQYYQSIASGKLSGVGRFVRNLDKDTLDFLIDLEDQYGSFVIKTHCGLNDDLIRFITNNKVKVFTMYRDPRDVILSAMDHRNRALKNGKKELSQFKSVKASIPHVLRWSEPTLEMLESGLCHGIRYTDMISNPIDTLHILFKVLEIPHSLDLVKKIVKNEKSSRKLHRNQFNKGVPLRYIDEMCKVDIEHCDAGLKELINRFEALPNNFPDEILA